MKAKKPNAAPGSSLPPPSPEQVRQRAHRLWIEAGRPEGRDREHWEEAERQLSDPSNRRSAQQEESKSEVDADKRVDGLGPESRDPRTPAGERL